MKNDENFVSKQEKTFYMIKKSLMKHQWISERVSLV